MKCDVLLRFRHLLAQAFCTALHALEVLLQLRDPFLVSVSGSLNLLAVVPPMQQQAEATKKRNATTSRGSN